MSEVSKISFKSAFLVKFPNKSTTFVQKEKGAKYLLERMTEYLNRWDKVDYPKVNYEKKDIYSFEKSNETLPTKNPDIEIDIFNIYKQGKFLKNNFKKVLSAFIVKDKNNQNVNIFVVAKSHFDNHFKLNLWKVESDYYFNKTIVKWSKLQNKRDSNDWQKQGVKDRIDGITECVTIIDKKIKTSRSFNKTVEKIKKIINLN